MDKKEVARYLKYGRNEPDSVIAGLIDECCKIAQEEVQPKSVYRIFSCQTDENGAKIGDLYFKSKSLAKCLKDCDRAVVIAVTLGIKADNLIKRYSVTDMAKATVFQGVFATMIEEYIDEIEEKIISENNVRLRPRYSPGFGDLTLEAQKDIFNILEVQKRIGVALTQSLLMVPMKSVSAIIGIYKENCNEF